MERITVVKIGGNVIDSPEATARFVEAFAALEGPKMLIHGGGKLATRLAAQLGIESRMVDGRRITDRETLDVVTMVYAGLINKRLVAALSAAGCRAIGLSGADGDAVTSVRRAAGAVDYGYVGDIAEGGVNVELLRTLLDAGLTPVFSAITCDGRGTLLNTNADSVASAVAVAASRIAPTQLVFCFEKAGVLRDVEDERSVIAEITPDTYAALRAEGAISAGMLPKIDGALRAVASGVESVVIKQAEAVALLEKLVATPSVSRDEARTADLLRGHLAAHGIAAERLYNNVYARAAHFDAAKPTLLLNSHHDTVRPTAAWTRDPFAATWEGERLYGLGANDAGASVAALTAAFRHYYDAELPFNLLLALSGEEECMGEHGTRALLPALGPIDMALVGEPTRMRAAVGERGLVVLDCTAHGRAGHAARDEGINALYIAADDIAWLRGYRFERCSPLLGPIRMTATQIEAGTQHNVVPAECRFVVDVRTTDAYTNEETVEIVRRHMRSEAVPRSTRIRASAVAPEHPLVGAAAALGVERFVSPTTSDMALMAFPSLKMGAGDSARSHTADEYVLRSEVEQGVEGYIRYIAELAKRY